MNHTKFPRIILLLFCGAGLLFATCTEGQPEPVPTTSNVTGAKESNPLLGGWYLVHGEYGEDVRPGPEPFQFKIFGEDQFAFLMQSPDGEWDYASTGNYELVGEDIYRETFEFSTEEQFVGVTADWKYRISNDTLYMEGPVYIVDATGKEAPELAGGYTTMREIRVR